MDSCPAWHAAPLESGAGSLNAPQSLGRLHKGARGTVVAVLDGDAALMGDGAGSSIARRLIEIGFVAGERFEIIQEVRPGGDPIAVRIGNSIFALRRREAQAVVVVLEAP